MSSTIQTLVTSVLLQILLAIPAYCDCNSYYCDVDDDWAIGVVVSIIVGIIIFFIVLIVLLCFCCGWCCFVGRRASKRGQVYAPQAVISTVQPGPYQQYPGVTVVNTNYPQGQAPYPTQPPQQYVFAQPPQYPHQPQPQSQQNQQGQPKPQY